MATFNLRDLAFGETTTVQLVNPATQEPLFVNDDPAFPVQVVVYGRNSKVYREWQVKASRKDDKKPKTAESIKENTADFLATVTKQIINIDLDGKPLVCFDDFKHLYNDTGFIWLGEQIIEAMGDAEGFLQK